MATNRGNQRKRPMKNKAFEFRIYPNKEQRILLAKTFGCSRLVYNHFLALRKERYEEYGETVSYNQCAKELTQLKIERSFLKEVDSVALQQSLRHLDIAFDRFFKKGSGYPKGQRISQIQMQTQREEDL